MSVLKIWIYKDLEMTWFILIAFFTIFAVVLGKLIYDVNSGKDKEFTKKCVKTMTK